MGTAWRCRRSAPDCLRQAVQKHFADWEVLELEMEGRKKGGGGEEGWKGA
jgi:hypothetical protein